MNVFDAARARLNAFGYELADGDGVLLEYAVDGAVRYIKNDCNVPEIPEGLFGAAADLAAAEFLRHKKTFAPDSIAGLELSASAVKQIQIGDTSATFGGGSLTAEQRLDALIERLISDGRGELACYRKIRW